MYERKRTSHYKKEKKKKLWKMAALIGISAEVAGMLLLFALQVVGMTGDLSNDTAPASNRMAQVSDISGAGQAALGEDEDAAGKSEGGLVFTDELQFQDIKQNSGVPVIAIDPGHGGSDEGCSRQGIVEKDVNLQIAGLLKKELTDKGYQVMLLREKDLYLSKEQRAELANFYQADAYISIHQNEYETSAARGIETWYDGKDGEKDSKRLAALVHQETIKSSGAKTREIRDDAEFYVTGKTKMPSCLIETGFLSNAKERELLISPDYQEKLAAGIAAGIDLYFRPKTMYLTFDDGPSEENTSAVLDILKERNIKATFFVVGENVRKHPEVAKRIVEEGHSIGIHCYQHRYEKVYHSVDSYLKDFEKAYRAVYEVTGVKARLFRFPGGSVNAYNKKVRKKIIKKMTDQGYIYYDWNASLEDAVKKSTPEELIANAKESTLGRKKVVLLAHDIVYETSACLEELLDAFPEYKMEALTPDIEPIQFRQ